MKKIILSAACAIIATGAFSQKITVLEEGAPFGGMMPQCISPNGMYVGGSTFAGMMFMEAWENHNYIIVDGSYGSQFENYGSEIRGISNDGTGIGFDDRGAVMVNLPSNSYELLQPIDTSKGIYDVLANSITADGSLVVGSVVNSSYSQAPVYWENGKLNYLPVPTDIDFGFIPDGFSAQQVTADGSIIMGYAIDNFATYPMVLWYRQQDGSYECDPVFYKYFEGGAGANEFLRFNGMSMSRNGAYIIMKVQYNTEDPALKGVNLLAMYTVADKSLKIIHIDGEHGIEPGTDCTVWFNGISDGGTVVGWITPSETGARYPFIMYADELQPILLSDAFPEIEELKVYDESESHSLSGISTNGRYICGMGMQYYPMYDMYYFVGYVLDTMKEDAGVSSIFDEDKRVTGYFGIDGLQKNELGNGINIIRYSDGTSRKVIIK